MICKIKFTIRVGSSKNSQNIREIMNMKMIAYQGPQDLGYLKERLSKSDNFGMSGYDHVIACYSYDLLLWIIETTIMAISHQG